MSEIICYCKNVKSEEIERIVDEGVVSFKEVKKRTGAGTGDKCKKLHPKKRCCKKDIKRLIKKKSSEA